MSDVFAVVPVKDLAAAKQRLAHVLSADGRRELAVAMLEDVLSALAAVDDLAGIIVVTVDPIAAALARRFGALVWTDGARMGHTGAVMAASQRLAGRGASMLTIPGDVPLVRTADIRAVLAAHRAASGFTIVPARDERGSNTIVSSPADRVPLQFGPDSYFPHLAAARRCGVAPTIVRRPRIALDIDEPSDLAELMKTPSRTRTRKLLDRLLLPVPPTYVSAVNGHA